MYGMVNDFITQIQGFIPEVVLSEKSYVNFRLVLRIYRTVGK
jgi:hypothetical protein